MKPDDYAGTQTQWDLLTYREQLAWCDANEYRSEGFVDYPWFPDLEAAGYTESQWEQFNVAQRRAAARRYGNISVTSRIHDPERNYYQWSGEFFAHDAAMDLAAWQALTQREKWEFLTDMGFEEIPAPESPTQSYQPGIGAPSIPASPVGRPRQEIQHGTVYTYNNGCRCEDCRAAGAANRRQRKERLREEREREEAEAQRQAEEDAAYRADTNRQIAVSFRTTNRAYDTQQFGDAVAQVRAEFERLQAEEDAAFERGDIDAAMALREDVQRLIRRLIDG